MNIVPLPSAPTAAEASLGKIQSFVDEGLRHVGAAIAEFNRGYEEFWAGEAAEIEARANLMGPEAVLLMFERNRALAELLNAAIGERNAALAASGKPPLTGQVMHVEPARDLAWTGETFVINPPQAEEP